MITDRPLRDVPLRALYALHRGIEGQIGLRTGKYRDHTGVCALGSLTNAYCGVIDRVNVFIFLGLINDGHVPRQAVARLNDDFKGTPEERREFMLRHIVEELRQRGKSLPKEHEKSTKILANEKIKI